MSNGKGAVDIVLYGVIMIIIITPACPTQITHMFRCANIEGLDTVEGLEGLLLFGREHFYVVINPYPLHVSTSL